MTAESNGWRVEYFEADGGCYVTIFAGPAAEKRRAIIPCAEGGRMKIVREPLLH
jgi:hypothetical protein